MPADYSNEMIACAAILLALIILSCLPRDVRRALFVVTAGAGLLAAAARFAAIPGSRLRHLFHNKHELTWTKLG